MHEENFLNSWLREDTEGKEEEEMRKKTKEEENQSEGKEWCRKKWKGSRRIVSAISVPVGRRTFPRRVFGRE